MLGLPTPRSRPVWFWPSCTHTKLHTQQLRAGQSSWGWLLGATHLRCHCLEGRNCAWGGGIACAPIEGLQLFSSWEHSLWWLQGFMEMFGSIGWPHGHLVTHFCFGFGDTWNASCFLLCRLLNHLLNESVWYLIFCALLGSSISFSTAGLRSLHLLVVSGWNLGDLWNMTQDSSGPSWTVE